MRQRFLAPSCSLRVAALGSVTTLLLVLWAAPARTHGVAAAFPVGFWCGIGKAAATASRSPERALGGQRRLGMPALARCLPPLLLRRRADTRTRASPESRPSSAPAGGRSIPSERTRLWFRDRTKPHDFCAQLGGRARPSPARPLLLPRLRCPSRARSSAGQSSGLIIRWSQVRVLAGPNAPRRLAALVASRGKRPVSPVGTLPWPADSEPSSKARTGPCLSSSARPLRLR